ncbi:MAG TPA: response regulator [Gemmatimonadaceae bacterium]
MTGTTIDHNGGASADLGVALPALREHFRASSEPLVATFERLAAQLTAMPTSARALEALRRDLRRVETAAENYGFLDATMLAAKLAERVAAWSTDSELDRDSRSTLVTHFVSALRLAFQHPLEAGQLPTLTSAPRRRMLLVGVSDRTRAALTERAAARGYALEVGASPAPVRDRVPHLVVTPREHEARSPHPPSDRWLPTLHISDSLEESTDADRLFDRADALLVATTWLRPTVLLLDDDASILEIARYSLGSGLRIVTLDSPLRVFETLEREQPVVLLLEARLPSFDAIAFTRLLRGMIAYRELPIVMLGGNLDSATLLAAYDAGIDEMLTKPLVPLELRARVAHRLERLRVERLTKGLHAMTSIPLPSRAREGLAIHQGLIAAGRRATSVLLTPRLVEGDSSRTIAWLRESRRLVHAIGATARFAAYRDDLALLLILDAPSALAQRVLESLRLNKPGEAPDWDAAVDEARGPEGFLTPSTPKGHEE